MPIENGKNKWYADSSGLTKIKQARLLFLKLQKFPQANSIFLFTIQTKTLPEDWTWAAVWPNLIVTSGVVMRDTKRLPSQTHTTHTC